MSNAPGTAADRLKRELHRAIDTVRLELDRIEVLLAGLAAFSQPVPGYEPGFQHLRHLTRHSAELNQSGSRN